jgi:hypothetical protein
MTMALLLEGVHPLTGEEIDKVEAEGGGSTEGSHGCDQRLWAVQPTPAREKSGCAAGHYRDTHREDDPQELAGAVDAHGRSPLSAAWVT